ncbi:tetratricopeptide repeat protein [Candidatus Poribacteria bacterium]|nr:tetratricopeptide repeat protein [Candidatus Poribacteria bacterium]
MKKIFVLTLLAFICACSKGTEVMPLQQPAVSTQLPKGSDQDELVNAKMRVKEYEKMLETAPNDIEMRNNLGNAYYYIKDYNRAINNFNIVLEIEKNNLFALTNLGNIYYDMNKHDKAIEYYKKVLELDPKDLNIRCDLGSSYKEIGMIDAAMREYRKCIEMDYTHINAHHNLAIVLYLSNKPQESEREMKIYDSLMKVAR